MAVPIPMSKPSPKLELFASFAAVAKAAAHPNRLDLLEHIAQGERPVDALAAVSGLSVANASQHLLQMRRGGLVVSRRDGKRILYRLSSDRVLDLSMETATELASGPTLAHAMTKTMLHQEWDVGIDEAIEMEAQAQAALMQSRDFHRAYQAFAAKRKPAFEGD